MMKYLAFLQYLLLQFTVTSSIDCDDVIRRATNWAERAIPYSMTATTTAPDGARYRTDCSGYVSMAWKLPSSLTTVTLPSVANKIAKDDLRRGDIILKGPPKPGQVGHVVIFERWATDNRNSYWGYEQTPPKTIHRIISYPYFGRSGYVPFRFKSITCTGAGTGSTGGSAGCSCCKGNALGEFCGHELCGNCLANNIYGCNVKDASPSIQYGACSKGCTGSSNSRAKCNK